MAAGVAQASAGGSVGLFTSLPIRWREADSVRELLNPHSPHWAMAVLEAHGELRPLDRLLPGRKGSPLKGVGLLVMAQPRALAPQENVALDAWVRRGGLLLLLADPMLTGDSRFSPGDPRRPQDMAMLSPILAHWGLRMEFDEEQQAGERDVQVEGTAIPVDLPGKLVLAQSSGKCAVLADGIAARCTIGRGRVVVLADAVLLEDRSADDARHRDALERLIALLGA